MGEPLASPFGERLQEIQEYLTLLEGLEQQIRGGPPKLGGMAITTQQQKILYSSVYLQLYNLVEATATWCIEGVAAAAADTGRWKPGDLSPSLRREWIRTKARTHVDLNPENRLETAIEFCEWLLEQRPLEAWAVEKGRGGNWDDAELESIAGRLGVSLTVSPGAYEGIKRKIRDDKGPLVLTRDLRNRLAHGSLSFTECGANVTVADLRDLVEKATRYLSEVVSQFQIFIDGYSFLAPDRRPTGGDAR